jgi:hypothetical protein
MNSLAKNCGGEHVIIVLQRARIVNMKLHILYQLLIHLITIVCDKLAAMKSLDASFIFLQ